MSDYCQVCCPLSPCVTGGDATTLAKYKCPRCRTPYCSVSCYKGHNCGGDSGGASGGCLVQVSPPPLVPSSVQETTPTSTSSTLLAHTLLHLQQQACFPRSRLASLLSRPALRSTLLAITSKSITLAQATLTCPEFPIFLEECGVLESS